MRERKREIEREREKERERSLFIEENMDIQVQKKLGECIFSKSPRIRQKTLEKFG
jgi:hypothetical protein